MSRGFARIPICIAASRRAAPPVYFGASLGFIKERTPEALARAAAVRLPESNRRLRIHAGACIPAHANRAATTIQRFEKRKLPIRLQMNTKFAVTVILGMAMLGVVPAHAAT